jgi:THO complex subunit 2
MQEQDRETEAPTAKARDQDRETAEQAEKRLKAALAAKREPTSAAGRASSQVIVDAPMNDIIAQGNEERGAEDAIAGSIEMSTTVATPPFPEVQSSSWVLSVC